MKTQLRAGFSIDTVSPGYCEQVEGWNPRAGGSGCPAEQALPAGVFDWWGGLIFQVQEVGVGVRQAGSPREPGVDSVGDRGRGETIYLETREMTS